MDWALGALVTVAHLTRVRAGQVEDLLPPGQHVKRVQLLIALRPVPLVIGRRTARDESDDPALAPGDADPLPGVRSCEQTRPHHPPTLARGVIVEALREQPNVGFPPRLNVDRGQLFSVG